MNKTKESILEEETYFKFCKIENFYKKLGFSLLEVKGSVFREKASTFIFQTDSQNHTVDCSTILYDDAVKIYQSLKQYKEELVAKLEKMPHQMTEEQVVEWNKCHAKTSPEQAFVRYEEGIFVGKLRAIEIIKSK